MMGKVPWWMCIFWWCAIGAAVDNWIAYWAIVAFWLFLVPAPLWWATKETERISKYDRFILRRALSVVARKDIDIEITREYPDVVSLHIKEREYYTKEDRPDGDLG